MRVSEPEPGCHAWISLRLFVWGFIFFEVTFFSLFFFFFFPSISQSLLACHPLVSNRQALSTSLSWREGWGAVFSPKFMGGKPGGAFSSPHKPLPVLFPLHPCPLPCSCCDCLDWQQETLFHLPFLLSPNTPGPWLDARAAPGPWQSWGCEFSLQRAESLNPLLGDGWIIRNFICWAGNKQLCICCCFADVSWGNSDTALKLQGWVFTQLAWLPAQVSGKAL